VSRMLLHDIDQRLTSAASTRINNVLSNPKGLPNGKHRRTRLTPKQQDVLRSKLIDAVEHAAVFANEPLRNRARARGRPPDNAFFVFINDIVTACEAARLKPGLRYVVGSESLPVLLYKELAPLVWPGRVANPRRLFERWKRLRSDLVRL
jgi:hypothetical protein